MITTAYIFNKEKMYEDFKDDPLYTKEKLDSYKWIDECDGHFVRPFNEKDGRIGFYVVSLRWCDIVEVDTQIIDGGTY